MKGVIYARYSSDMQREESIDAQVAACREYATSKEIDIIRIYADKAQSAKTAARPEFQKMIAESKGFDVVLVHKYNRFARRMQDHLNYEDKLAQNECQLISVTEDFGSGKNSIIIKAVIQAMSQYYLMDLADEVKKGHKENAKHALFNGGCGNFGYDIINQKYYINEQEAYWVQKMFDCAYSKKSFKPLIEEMAAAGVKGKRGKPIKYTSIYEILRNEKYTGVYIYDVDPQRHNRRDKKNAIRIEGAIPQIISKEVFNVVQENRKSRKLSNTDYLLKGLVYCSECNKKMNVHIATKRNEQPYFVCNTKGCPTKTIRMEYVEKAVEKYVKAILTDESMEELKLFLAKYQKAQNTAERDFKKAIEKQLIDKNKILDGLILKLALIDDDMVPIITEQIRTTKKEIEAIELQEPPESFSPVQIEQFVEHLGKDFDRNTIYGIVERVEITKEKEVKVYSTLTSLLGISSPHYGGDTQI